MAVRGLGKLGPATVLVAFICGLSFLGTAFAENVPLPTPAPLPKTGVVPPPAATRQHCGSSSPDTAGPPGIAVRPQPRFFPVLE